MPLVGHPIYITGYGKFRETAVLNFQLEKKTDSSNRVNKL